MTRRIVVLGVAVTLAAVAAGWWVFQRVSQEWRPALTSREIATRVLGEQLARMYPGAKALVVGNPFTQREGQDPEIYAFERAGIEGLQFGFKLPESLKVVYPQLRPEFLSHPDSVFVDPKTTTPLSFLVAEGEFDRLYKANPGFEIVVSLIGLPTRIISSEVWEAGKPHFGLLLPDWRTIGTTEEIRAAVKSGKIAAAVVNRPGAEPSATIAPNVDYHAEFEQRYLLVTPANIDELLESHPRLW